MLLLTVLVSPTLPSQNFAITNDWPQDTKAKWEEVAESYRAKWLEEFVGKDIPYEKPIPLTINFDNRSKSGSGVTAYDINANGCFNYRMTVNGPPERIQNSIIPHEVMHTVMAHYMKASGPRWADEGYCTYIEPKYNDRFNRSKFYPFKLIMNMEEYPPDVATFYGQSCSMVRWLVNLKDKRHFRDFIYDYMHTKGDWPLYLEKYYGFKTYEDAQAAWLVFLQGGGIKEE